MLKENEKLTIDEIRKLFIKAKISLDDYLKELPQYGCECNCNPIDREPFRRIHEGNFDEIEMFCLKCGGVII